MFALNRAFGARSRLFFATSARLCGRCFTLRSGWLLLSRRWLLVARGLRTSAGGVLGAGAGGCCADLAECVPLVPVLLGGNASSREFRVQMLKLVLPAHCLRPFKEIRSHPIRDRWSFSHLRSGRPAPAR